MATRRSEDRITNLNTPTNRTSQIGLLHTYRLNAVFRILLHINISETSLNSSGGITNVYFNGHLHQAEIKRI